MSNSAGSLQMEISASDSVPGLNNSGDEFSMFLGDMFDLDTTDTASKAVGATTSDASMNGANSPEDLDMLPAVMSDGPGFAAQPPDLLGGAADATHSEPVNAGNFLTAQIHAAVGEYSHSLHSSQPPSRAGTPIPGDHFSPVNMPPSSPVLPPPQPLSSSHQHNNLLQSASNASQLGSQISQLATSNSITSQNSQSPGVPQCSSGETPPLPPIQLQTVLVRAPTPPPHVTTPSPLPTPTASPTVASLLAGNVDAGHFGTVTTYAHTPSHPGTPVGTSAVDAFASHHPSQEQQTLEAASHHHRQLQQQQQQLQALEAASQQQLQHQQQQLQALEAASQQQQQQQQQLHQQQDQQQQQQQQLQHQQLQHQHQQLQAAHQQLQQAHQHTLQQLHHQQSHHQPHQQPQQLAHATVVVSSHLQPPPQPTAMQPQPPQQLPPLQGTTVHVSRAPSPQPIMLTPSQLQVLPQPGIPISPPLQHIPPHPSPPPIQQPHAPPASLQTLTPQNSASPPLQPSPLQTLITPSAHPQHTAIHPPQPQHLSTLAPQQQTQLLTSQTLSQPSAPSAQALADPFRLPAQQQTILQQINSQAAPQQIYITTPASQLTYASPGPGTPTMQSSLPHTQVLLNHPNPLNLSQTLSNPTPHYAPLSPSSSALTAPPLPITSAPQQPTHILLSQNPPSHPFQPQPSHLQTLQRMPSTELHHLPNGTTIRTPSPTPLDLHNSALVHMLPAPTALPSPQSILTSPTSLSSSLPNGLPNRLSNGIPNGVHTTGPGVKNMTTMLTANGQLTSVNGQLGRCPVNGVGTVERVLLPNGLLATQTRVLSPPPAHLELAIDAMDMDDTKDVMCGNPRADIMRAVEALRNKLHTLEMEHTQLKEQCDEMERLDTSVDMPMDGTGGVGPGDLQNLLATMEERNRHLRAEITSLEHSIHLRG